MIGLTLLILAVVNGYLAGRLRMIFFPEPEYELRTPFFLSVPVIGPWLAFICLGGVVTRRMRRFHACTVFTSSLSPVLSRRFCCCTWQSSGDSCTRTIPARTAPTKRLLVCGFGPPTPPSPLAYFVSYLLLWRPSSWRIPAKSIPSWIDGPFDPAATLPGAQPDWYLGWVEGAMRLFPGINLHLGHRLIPEVFFPAVLLPSLIFAALYLYPFLEQLISFDDKPHNVLRLPYQQPFNTALGCAAFVFVLVLFFAGSDDVIAVATGGSVVEIRTILRVLVFIAPPVTAVLVYMLCARARRRRSASASD